jgi:D-alanyl-D-alanine carboxypeptidase
MAFFSPRIRQKIKWFLLLLLIIIAILVYLTVLGVRQNNERLEKASLQDRENFFISKTTDISAKSFLVYDISEKKIIFEKDKDLKTPLASITKLVTALVALENMPATSTVQVKKEAIAQEGDSKLLVNEYWGLKDLSDFSLISSSNDGIYAISQALDEFEKKSGSSTLSLMKEKATSLGMTNSSFLNSTGLDVNPALSGSYSTASDLNKLLSYIMLNYPNLISATSRQSESFISKSGIRHVAINTNNSVREIPALIGSKTGFTDLAGGNVAIIFDAGFNHPVIAIVLGSTQEEKFIDIVKLVKITLEKLSE